MIYKLSFFVPKGHLERVKEALFAKGAGRYKKYDKCSWETLGTGQFKPLDGSKPYLGRKGKTEKVCEYKVEMICTKDVVKAVVEELISVHPYEEVAYDVVEIKTLKDL